MTFLQLKFSRIHHCIDFASDNLNSTHMKNLQGRNLLNQNLLTFSKMVMTENIVSNGQSESRKARQLFQILTVHLMMPFRLFETFYLIFTG